MSARRRRPLARRLLTRADDAVSRRAPWLSERAYRAVTAPLQASDPVAAARLTQGRLDDVRERVRAMAASGRVTRADHRRFHRDLARTREDLDRLTPRLPALQGRILMVRLAAYTEALAALPGSPAVARSTSPRDSLVLGGAAATASAALLLPMAPAAEGGLVAAAASAAGFTAVQRRRARKQAITAVAQALDAADRATHSGQDADLRDHDARRRDPGAQVRGRPVADEVRDQLVAIEGGLARLAERPGPDDPETLLHLQGEFLRSKFGDSSL